MKNRNLTSRVAIFAFVVAFALTAFARQLLYYYDFDAVNADGKISAIENKGVGTAQASFKMAQGTPAQLVDGEYLWKTDGGPFGSAGYSLFSYNSPRSVWLPDREGNLGCSTTNGFTISTWIKYSSNRNNWADFLGFVVGSYRYFCEHTGSVGEIALYGAIPGQLSTKRLATLEQPAGDWGHLAIVFTPTSTNQLCGIDIYVNGNLVTNTYARGEGHGILKQVHIGATTKGEENVRNQGASQTSVDEFAIFDYPATAEQIKWLTKHKPGQPNGGPGREMPLCWRFEQIEYNQTRTLNSGTGFVDTRILKNIDGTAYIASGALSTRNAYSMADGNTLTFAATNTTDGLGATAGSGFSFSFWLKADATPREWSDFFGFVLGSQSLRLEWTDKGSPRYCNAYGGSTDNIGWSAAVQVNAGRTPGEWQHIALSFNNANSNVDIYTNGFYSVSASAKAPIALSERIEKITVGPYAFVPDKDSQGSVERCQAAEKQTIVDEFAFFNYSISPEEIAWLGANIPRLPPLTATNLTRTISADSSWSGALASWNVLDEVGADTGRRSIYPSCEDTEVEVGVSIAADATIVNDTFVTPAKLKFANAVGGDVASAKLVSAPGSMFAPETMELGEGVWLIVSPGEVSVTETLRFAQGAKIVFDMSNADEETIVKGLAAGSFVLPSDDSDLISHFAVRGGTYDIVISGDGKSINIKKRPGFRFIIR